MAPTRTADRVPRITRGELAILGLFVIGGIAGVFPAYRQLTTLRVAHETEMVNRSRELARLRSENDRLLQREQEGRAAKPPAPIAPVSESPGESATVSRADRTAALLSLAKIVTRGTGALALRSQQRMMLSRTRAMAQIGRQSPVPLPERPAYLVGPDNQLPARFGELFGIGDNEVSRLQQALTSTRERVDELTAAATTIRDNGNGSYTLQVNPLTDDQVAPQRDQMISTFREVLGDDAYRAFALLNGESQNPDAPVSGPAAFFNSFGTSGRTAIVSKTDRGYRYEMQFGANGRASGGAATSEDLRVLVGGGIKLLPPGF